MKRFVNFFTCFIFVILFLGMSASNIFAFSSGPPDGRTGSPADSGNTCNASGCHNDFTTNSGTLAFSITAPGNYTPGTASSVTVSFNNSSSGILGFELMALDASNNPVGTLSASDANTQVSGNYIKHTTAGNNHGANASWTFEWTPSAGQTGAVTFYAAGNEADGGASPSNDYIYTATKSVLEPGASPVPIPAITANRSTVGPSGTLTIDVSLSTAGASSLADTGPADFWVYATIPGGATFYLDSSLTWALAAPIQPTLQGTLPDFSSTNVLDSSTLGATLPLGDYVFTFSVDDNMDGVKDDTFTDTASVTIREVSFSKDIVVHFNTAAGTGAWFPYGDPDITTGTPSTSCGGCHAGDDGIDPEECPPECHLMDLNTYAGWMLGADGGTEPLLGEAVAGTGPFDWNKAKLRKRLRNNRMPPGIPFNIDEANRNGGDIVTTNDGNDIDLGGGKFFVSVAGTTGRGEVEYGGTDNAVGLLEAYVASLDGDTTGYAGVAGAVVFADVAGLFSEANVWYNGGLSCTACHYCDEEPPCFHEIDFNNEAGILAGADGGTEPLLGEDEATGGNTYNWGESGLRARLRNNRMPPNAPFDVDELTRMGPTLIHPLTGARVRLVDLIGEWVTGSDGVKGTSDDAKDN